MSKEAIQAVIAELELLPDADQRLVLSFLAKLRQHHLGPISCTSVPKLQPALALRDKLLVFTGQLEEPDTDWVRLVRDERDQDVLHTALRATPEQ
jgi:hypothetical protein